MTKYIVMALAALSLNAAEYGSAILKLREVVAQEMRDWKITGISIALVDDQQTVHAEGFGEARVDSVFRCGSISKLFNAVAVMQLVEAGRLDLDAPLERYAAEILPVNPFATNGPMTLRQLLSHKSGIVRESAVGGYFDGTEPGFERMIGSLRQSVLPTAPKARTRYSNVGPSLAGYIAAQTAGLSFDQYEHEHILAPLGMTNSAWRHKQIQRGQIIPSYMRVADGRGGFTHRRAPLFDLGTLPAGNLFTTAPDLASFIAMLAAEGRTRNGAAILRPETLAAMFTPQFTTDSGGFGLAFSVGTFQGRKSVGHSGAVYGYSSSLVFLPGEKLGIVVLGNEDIANGRIQKIANTGLSLLLEAKLGEKPPAVPAPIQMAAEELLKFAGEYESQSYWATLEVKEGKLAGDISSQLTRFEPIEGLRFRADSAIYDASPAVFERSDAGEISSFRLGGQLFQRVSPNPNPVPPEWRKYFGSYGPSFIPLVISERHGHLYAMTENMVDYRLTPINTHVFELPPGMYVNEHLVFFSHNNKRPAALSLAGMILKRR